MFGTLHKDKRYLVLGIRNRESIAYDIVKFLLGEGAEIIGTYLERERAGAEEIGAELGIKLFQLNVEVPEQIDALFADIQEVPGWRGKSIDGLIHAIAFGKSMASITKIPKEKMRAWVNQAIDISATSFPMVAQVACDYMRPGSAFVALGYRGGADHEDGYEGPIGLAKVVLAHNMVTMARDYAAEPYRLRCNLVSPNPIPTASGKGIPGFPAMLARSIKESWLHDAISGYDVAMMVGFILSNEAAHFLNGKEFVLDGGRTHLCEVA